MSATPRRVVALPEPPGSAPLPQVEASEWGRPWYRAHHPDNGAWYFASAGGDDTDGGRFDLPQPRGTCYMASAPDVALRERLGILAVGRPLTTAAVAASAISIMTLTAAHKRNVVDTAHPAAANSITREISTTVDYALTRRWAAHWSEAERRSGVRYEPRFSTGPAMSLALFGTAGPARHRARRLTAGELTGVAAVHGVAAVSRRAADVIDDE